MNEPAEALAEAKRVTIPVNPARLAWGSYDHKRNRDTGEGDIHASYSADTIATASRVRKAFRWQAQLMVTVSLSGRGGIEQAEAYSLVPPKAFSGRPTTYTQRTAQAGDAEAARNDPKGFYHGMQVTCGRDAFLLSGPPVVFVAEHSAVRPDDTQYGAPHQLNLF
jgi:hypothetical protein